ncbi:MAG TPA: glycosyltransferase family 2 protein [Candidatus Nanoarchaeia archaeon]|nr:glycosyltransferase family 2 protein [Candidatus Nanoarchaeia archaeon]
MAKKQRRRVDISLVIPVYNEEKNLLYLYRNINRALHDYHGEYEIIFIDDGSSDGSLAVLQGLAREKDIRIVEFQTNYGKSAALTAGFKLAQGGLVITMDADLQDDPAEIPRFLDEIRHCDVVVGWKYRRKDPLSKTIPSRFFNYSIALLTKIRIHDSNCGFKAFRRRVIENIQIYGELHRYIPVLAFWKGFEVREMKIRHHPRIYGKSKYGIGRLFKGFLDLITVKFLISYGQSPFYLFGGIGIIFSVIGFILGVYLTTLKVLVGASIGRRPLLIFTMLLLVLGVQFIGIGLLGDMVSYQREKEQYIVKRII